MTGVQTCALPILMKGVKEIVLDGEKTEKIPVQEKGSTHEVVVILGK